MHKACQLSPCLTYRYRLDRLWDDSKPALLFVLYNPSTADASQDDPTLRRCIGFARSWGYGGLCVINLFSLRTPDPSILHGHSQPKGPDHERVFQAALKDHKDVVCAWGLQGGPISSHFSPGTHRIFHLGLNRDGSPKHPLYLPAHMLKQRWNEDKKKGHLHR